MLEWLRASGPAQVLGAGCNTLIATARLPRVLRVALRGRRIVADDGARVVIEAAAGED